MFGKSGHDTLIAPQGRANDWTLTGPAQGTLDGSVAFTSVANLTGAAISDTFHYLSASSAVTGTLNELGGKLTLAATALSGGGEAINIVGNVNTHGGDLVVQADQIPAPVVASTITVAARRHPLHAGR